jgi:phage regulator Rha-like protein
MTYEEFKEAYVEAFKEMQKYTVDQVGSGHFAQKLADLSDAYPDFENRLFDEPSP